MVGVRSDINRVALNIVAYSSGQGVFMKSSVNRSNEIRDRVLSVIKDIGHQNVVQLIIKPDCPPDVAAQLTAEHPRIYQTKCAAHGIEQILKNICIKVQWVRQVIDEAKLIVTYMYEDTAVLSLMKKYTQNRELKHSCMTRCASNFKMLQSLLDLQKELELLIASPQWRGLNLNNEEKAKEVTSIIQNSSYWSQGREVLQVLEPLVQVLRLVESEGSTSGYLYQAMKRAEATLGELCQRSNNEEKYKEIWLSFEEGRKDIIHPIHTVAAFLNPSYMCFENFKEDSQSKNDMNSISEVLFSGSELSSFMQQIQDYRDKDSSLFTGTAKRMLEAFHPRVWWGHFGDSLPILQKFAVRVLSQPCSFSSFEQSWNTFEAAQIKKRNRFAPHTLNDFVDVRMNMLMMENFKTIERKDRCPIDLEKLSELPEYIDPPKEDWETNSTRQNQNYEVGMSNATGWPEDHSMIGNGASLQIYDYLTDLLDNGIGNNQGPSSQMEEFNDTWMIPDLSLAPSALNDFIQS